MDLLMQDASLSTAPRCWQLLGLIFIPLDNILTCRKAEARAFWGGFGAASAKYSWTYCLPRVPCIQIRGSRTCAWPLCHSSAIAQVKLTYDGYLFDIPGGRTDGREPSTRTAERETFEESGYQAGRPSSRTDPVCQNDEHSAYLHDYTHTHTAQSRHPV